MSDAKPFLKAVAKSKILAGADRVAARSPSLVNAIVIQGDRRGAVYAPFDPISVPSRKIVCVG